MDKLISPSELEDLTGISSGTLQSWRWKGIGPKFLKLGKHVRYKMSDVENFIEEQSAKTKELQNPSN